MVSAHQLSRVCTWPANPDTGWYLNGGSECMMGKGYDPWYRKGITMESNVVCCTESRISICNFKKQVCCTVHNQNLWSGWYAISSLAKYPSCCLNDQKHRLFTEFKCRQRKQYARGQFSQQRRGFVLPFGFFWLRNEGKELAARSIWQWMRIKKIKYVFITCHPNRTQDSSQPIRQTTPALEESPPHGEGVNPGLRWTAYSRCLVAIYS